MSIRFWTILVICIALAILYSGMPGETVIRRSGRELDLAIVGHGYFVVSDLETAEVRYTRSGSMIVNEFGQLSTEIGGKEWVLEPPIHLPSDWKRVSVQFDGTVQCLDASTWTDIGQIQLARFMRTPAFENKLDGNVPSSNSGPPFVGDPNDTQSTIQQGWVEVPNSSSWILTRNLLVAILACIILNSFILHVESAENSAPNQNTQA